ncbi:MAG: tetratricopeptide repeat protein [bacterium]|nr:tetratricopeptide repeat protein [bacterium]
MSWRLELKVKESIAEIRRAHELAPSDSTITSCLASCEFIFGNFDRAITLGKAAVELDPLNPTACRELGRIFGCAGRHSEARETLLRALELSPDMTALHLALGYSALVEGKFEEACKLVEKETAGFRYCGLAMVAFALGRQEESDLHLACLRMKAKSGPSRLSCPCAYRDEVDKAFEWLERAYDIRDSGIPLTKTQPFLKSLHSDPRWPVFLKKIGMDD